jgi:hypothetical protein
MLFLVLLYRFLLVFLPVQADKHTRKETKKITKENSAGKTQVSKEHIYNSTINIVSNNK